MTLPAPGVDLRTRGSWLRVATAAGLADGDGEVRPTIFAEMSALATTTAAVNLGQGFPDVDGPEWIREAAVEAMRAGANQYPPGPGLPQLRQAIARHQSRHYGIDLDPEHEILVTAGATEAIAATVLALAGPGDEVLTLEPYYDSYAATIALAGATHTTVALRPTASGFRLDVEGLGRAVTPRTRLVLINTPHNPTGTVLTRSELAAIGDAARAVDAIVVTDEVYEHLTYGATHVPMASLPGMAPRTLTISSAGKTFSFTGWKIGWVSGPAELVEAVRTVKQFLTYVSGAPFQPAIARALDDDSAPAALAASLSDRRDLLCEGLRALGLEPVVPDGTYFVCADAAPWGAADAGEFARHLVRSAGVAVIPVTAFCRPGSATGAALSSWIRFTHVKSEDVLREALARLALAFG